MRRSLIGLMSGLMRPLLLSALVTALPLKALKAFATPGSPMVMTSPNSAVIQYSNHCANGANNDLAARQDFIATMANNPQSKLGALKAQLLRNIGDDKRGEGVVLTPLTQTFHDREGCGQSLNSFSFFVATTTGGNTNHYVVKALVTIDDDDYSGERTLKVRAIQPAFIRDEP